MKQEFCMKIIRTKYKDSTSNQNRENINKVNISEYKVKHL